MSGVTVAETARGLASGRRLLSMFAATPAGRSWALPDRRRALQLALASVWLLDGVLQMQPFMFSPAFGRAMLASSALGNPNSVARSILWTSREVGLHAGAANAVFCLVQITIAIGIASRRTVKPALAASIVWSVAVWWIGEGLGGVLSGKASTLTGAPGPVLLYALLAVLLWPVDEREGDIPGSIAARTVGPLPARAAWTVVFGTFAALSLETSDLTRDGLAGKVAAMAVGEPRWLSAVETHVASALMGEGAVVSISAAAFFVALAVSIHFRARAFRVALLGFGVVAAGIWVIGEAFGGIFSGVSTDPSSGPLLVLLACAYWPARSPGQSPAAAGRGAAGAAPASPGGLA